MNSDRWRDARAPMRPSSAAKILLAAAVGLVAPASAVAATILDRGTAPAPSHALAIRIAPEQVSEVIERSEIGAPDGSVALWVVVSVEWQPDATDPDHLVRKLDQALDRLAEAGASVVVRIDARHPEGSAELDEWRRGFLQLLRSVARVVDERASWFQLVGLFPADEPDAAGLAGYEIKSASVTLRAESPGAGIAVTVNESEFELLLAAYDATQDLDPYIDAIAVEIPYSHSAIEEVTRLRGRLLSPDPGASLWVEVRAAEQAGPSVAEDELLARAAEMIAAGSDLTVFRLDDAATESSSPGSAQTSAARSLEAFARSLPPGLGISPKTGAGIEPDPEEGVRWTRMFDEEQFAEVIVYWSPSVDAERDELTWNFASSMRRGYRVMDPVTGRESFLPADEEGDETVRVETPIGRRPRLLLVTRRRVSPGVEVDEGIADVRTQRGVTVEEIIAAHQRWRAFQEDRLRTIRRDGRISFRPRFGQFTGTADLTIDGDYFWEPSTGGEWVIREKYINGVRLNWDEVPEFPLINWEQVIQAPLDLNLDRRYSYEYVEAEEIDGRLCWKLGFEPIETQTGVSLFRGVAWIDQKSGALVQVKSVQTGLEAPVLSREERRLFRPYEGPDGTEYWLLDELEGQILQSVAGSNLVILQEWKFGPPRINDADFDSERRAAYESNDQMLRDTPEGFRWLTRTEDGRREVRTEPDTSQWFAAAGLLKDEGLGDSVVPLAGVNYVNVDSFNRGILFNMFLAGPLANITLSDPSLFSSSWDVGANLNAVGIAGTDRVFESGEEIDALRVKRLRQSLSLHAGHPIGDFLKLRGGFSIDWIDFRDDDETLPGFVIPSDHAELSTSLSLSFDRAGWGLAASGSVNERSEWQPWGSPGDLVSGDELERARDFTTWSVQGSKSWFLRSFQKIGVEAKIVGGSDLDRFSAFTFGFLSGDRVRGLGGSGIRYDRGLLANVEYEFNVKEVVRFDADIDHAEVDELSGTSSSHTGVGFAANFPGPWETLIRLDVGYALSSDVEEVEGDTEFLLVVLRLF